MRYLKKSSWALADCSGGSNQILYLVPIQQRKNSPFKLRAQMYYRHDFIEGAFCNFQPPALTKYFPFSQSLVQTLLAIYLICFICFFANLLLQVVRIVDGINNFYVYIYFLPYFNINIAQLHSCVTTINCQVKLLELYTDTKF